jgi:hypothetical protein
MRLQLPPRFPDAVSDAAEAVAPCTHSLDRTGTKKDVQVRNGIAISRPAPNIC